jgi:hypothetical protein
VDLDLRPNQGLQDFIRLGTGDAPALLRLPLAGLISTAFPFDGVSIAALQLVPKYQLNLRIDTKSSFGINSVLLAAPLEPLQR